MVFLGTHPASSCTISAQKLSLILLVQANEKTEMDGFSIYDTFLSSERP